MLQHSKKRQFGQGMTEYIIIVALIAVAAIGVYSLFGKTVRHQVAGMANELSGTSASGEIGKAGKAAGSAQTTADKKVTLGNYNETATDAASK